jgi:transcriptional regulator with XRE-family HTH domain
MGQMTERAAQMAWTEDEDDEDGLDEEDDLDRYIAERARVNPDFPALVEAAMRERQLLRALAAKRAERGLSQREVAARMGTSQAAVARLERGEGDPTVSTLARFALALGQQLEWRLVEDGAMALTLPPAPSLPRTSGEGGGAECQWGGRMYIDLGEADETGAERQRGAERQQGGGE